MKKKILYGCIVSGLAVIIAGISLFLVKEEQTQIPEQTKETKTVKQTPTVKQETVQEKNTEIQEKSSFNPNKYSQYEIPLISINEISKLSEKSKTALENLMEKSQGAYFIKYNPEKKDTVLLLQNLNLKENKYLRHNLQYVHISDNGEVKIFEAGYSGEDGEISNAVNQTDDVWEFDESIEPPRPLKHVAFDDNGKISFMEYWNYSDDNEIKYEMKDKKGKTISVLKELQNDENNFRREHVFYDDKGKTSVSISESYVGADLKHFSFYDETADSIIIESEFKDGIKTEEKIYNKNFEQVKTVKPEYKDGELKSIQVLNISHAENSLKEE